MWYFTVGIIVAILIIIVIWFAPPDSFGDVRDDDEALGVALLSALCLVFLVSVWPLALIALPFYIIIRKERKKKT